MRNQRTPPLSLFAVLMTAVLALSLLLPAPSMADPAATAELARNWRQAHEQRILDDFAELLRIPNVAGDAANIRRNAGHIAGLLGPRGFEVRLLEVEGAPPAVFAERRAAGAERTLMIYAHYDGQPVDPEEWASDPWTPVLRDGPVELGGRDVPMQAPFDPEWRIFARSAGVGAQGYFVVHDEPSAEQRATNERIARLDWEEAGYPAYRTPLDLPIANHDNNQHGRNENLRLQNLWDAIEIYAAVLTNM